MSRTQTIDIDYDDLPRLRQRELGRYYDSDDNRPRRDRNDDYEYRRRSYVVEDDGPRSRRRDYDAREEQQMVPYRGTDQDTQVVAHDPRRDYDYYERRRDDYDGRRDCDNRHFSEQSSSRSGQSWKDRRRRRDDGRSRGSADEGANSADEGLLFYSGKKRKDASFLEKNFDSSYEGITAAIAGGLIGGMTARRFGGEENRKAKVVAATAIGAAGFNAAENWYRIYTEERAERKEERRERRDCRN